MKYIIHRIFDVTPFIQEKDVSALMEAEMHRHIKNIDEVNKQLRITDAVYHAIINAIPDAMLTINKEVIITDVNKALEILFGYDRHELLGQQMEILMPESYRSQHKSNMDKYFKAPKLRAMGVGRELFGVNKNGDIFPVEIGLSPLELEKEKFAVAIIHDISLRVNNTKNSQVKEYNLKKANTKLISEKQILDISNKKGILLTEFSETLISCKNKEDMIVVISSYVSKLLDFSKGVFYIFDSTHKYLEANSSWGDIANYDKIIKSDECLAIRCSVIHITSATEPSSSCDHIMEIKQEITCVCVPLVAQNEIFGLIYLEISSINPDILDNFNLIITMVSKTIALAFINANLRNLLRDQSIRDSLTGLFNRRFLDEYLIKQVFYAKRNNLNIAIIMFDIDNFKNVNDTYGHDVGDTILEKIGHLMTRLTRADDVICRYGGEEFVCVLQNCSLTLAKKRAEEIRKEISNMTKGNLPKITISLGISMYPTDAIMPNELVEASDKALYQSKKTGKNKVTAYSDMDK